MKYICSEYSGAVINNDSCVLDSSNNFKAFHNYKINKRKKNK